MAEEQTREESLNEEIKKRKTEILDKLKRRKGWILYLAMVIIAWVGYYIRTRNIPLLSGKWLPDVDSYAFLRYAEYIAEHGKLMANDALRYYPFGFDPRGEFGILSYVIAYLGKVMHFFNPSATTVDAAILYPALSFFVAAIFFFLFVKKLINYKVALIATAFLAVVPAFLYRTMAGVADKEALAVALMFAVLYFYVLAFKSEKPAKAVIYGLIAGIISGILATVWGGYVFVVLALGAHMIICSFIDALKKESFYGYVVWMLSFMIFAHLFYPERFPFMIFFTSITTQIMLVGFLMPLIMYMLKLGQLRTIKNMVAAKMPLGLFALIVTIIAGILFIIILSGPSVIWDIVSEVYTTMTKQFATTRWQVTVAENHQPYFTDWIGQFSWKYLAMVYAGALFIFYNTISHIKSLKRATIWGLTAFCALFLLLFSMSRYSSSSTLNGETGIAQLVYIGSLVVFIAVLGYGYVAKIYKNQEARESLEKIDVLLPLIFIWLIIMIIAARSAIRLLFIFAPVTAVLAGYFTVMGFEFGKRLKKDAYKIAVYIVIAFIMITALYPFYKTTLAQAAYVGPSFNSQWQNAMGWVKENTPENAVFAHWWDYGYWVQWGGNRATIVDGGNAMGSVNHFVGRHVLTAKNETEVLGFLKSRNVTHLLIISDEIGKYPAYSSIGANREYDRYSWISTFTMQPNQIKETRNETVYLFTGGTPLDDDFVYQGNLFPAGSAGVAGFFLPVATIDVNTGNGTAKVQRVMQPKAVIVYNGQQVQVPLRCAYINGQEMVFSAKDALEGCLRVIPTIEGSGQINPLGAAFYLSPEVYSGMFAQLYLLNKEYSHIRLAYSDENTGMPLAIYQGRMIGPLKIWEITYPENITVAPEYYKIELPDPELDKIKRAA